YAVAWDLESAHAYRSDIRARAAALGRDPESIAVMPGLVVHVAATEADARRVRADLDSRLPVADSLRQLSFFIGQDASDWELDAPVPPLPPRPPDAQRRRPSRRAAGTRPSPAPRSPWPTRSSAGSTQARPTASASRHPPAPAGSPIASTKSSPCCSDGAGSAASTKGP